MDSVEIELLGRRYVLRTDRTREHLEAVAKLLERRTRDISGGAPLSRDHVVLLALNLGSELLLARDEERRALERVDAQLERTITLLDAALPEGG